MKIGTVIVEDEDLARRRMRQLVEPFSDLEILGECSQGVEAVQKIKELRPQLVFLDVQMPELNGFEVLERLDRESMPMVVFTTAYDEHAVRAFEENAVDYLVKPISRGRFEKAMARVFRLLRSEEASASVDRLLRVLNQSQSNTEGEEPISRLTIRNEDRVAVVKVSEIRYIESAGNYVSVNVKDGAHILRDSLNHLEKQLASSHFFRVSRSALVNLDYVCEFQPTFKGESVVVLDTGAKVPVTRGIRELESALRSS